MSGIQAARPVKPSNKPQHVARVSSLSRLIKGWSKETEEVGSRNLVFQQLKDGASGGGREIPSCLFKWLHFLSRALHAFSILSGLHSGSKETVNTYCGQASSHESPELDGHSHAYIPVPFPAGDPPLSLQNTPVTPNTIRWVLTGGEQTRLAFSKVTKSR